MDREKLADYLQKQINSNIVFDLSHSNENGWHAVKREAVYKILDGFIPMLKNELNKPAKKRVCRKYEDIKDCKFKYAMVEGCSDCEEFK